MDASGVDSDQGPRWGALVIHRAAYCRSPSTPSCRPVLLLFRDLFEHAASTCDVVEATGRCCLRQRQEGTHGVIFKASYYRSCEEKQRRGYQHQDHPAPLHAPLAALGFRPVCSHCMSTTEGGCPGHPLNQARFSPVQTLVTAELKGTRRRRNWPGGKAELQRNCGETVLTL
jgi:hypothetical protein